MQTQNPNLRWIQNRRTQHRTKHTTIRDRERPAAQIFYGKFSLVCFCNILFDLLFDFREAQSIRAAPLSQLWQIVGKRQAIWMMASWFGLGHYYGGVSFGAAGVIYLTLLAVLFGKAMVETRGLGVPVFMHLWGDVVLYIILALGSA
jgi:hypothetical protein